MPISPLRLATAYALDLAAGDPEWFPHPVRAIGMAISAGERCLRCAKDDEFSETAKGVLLTGTIVVGSWGIARAFLRTSATLPGPWAAISETVLAWTTLTTRSLLLEARKVLDALDEGDLDVARRRLSRIVGRDTESLDENDIARAVIETVAESACDGIVAPLTWLAIGGAPAAMGYKAVNTLDSMIGHPEPPYQNFGHCAARLDDAANLAPARLTALCIVAAAFLLGYDARSAWHAWLRDGGKHASPNAGQSEAAMAGALGVRLGGTNVYNGRPVQTPILGASGNTPVREHAHKALRIVAAASGVAFGATFLYSAWRHRQPQGAAR